MNQKELRIVPALEGQDDQLSAKILPLGNPGISWAKVQELMRVTRGLPVQGPPGTAQAVRRQQARRNGFNLCIRVPPALHRKSTGSEDWHVRTETEWLHFLSVIPFDEAAALGAVKELSRWQLGGWAYAAAMAGWHMLWEVAVSGLTRGLGGIWGVSDVMLLVDAIASSLQVVDNPRDRVGKATAGACAAAALWWLLCQPRSPLHTPAQDSVEGSSAQAQDVHEAITAASELYLRSWEPSQETPQSSGGGRLKQAATLSTLLEEGVHPKDLQVVRATPLPHHMLHCLLQSGLLRVSTAKLRELSLALLGNPGKAEVLKASFRRNHTAKAAAWSAGALFQALSMPYVQGALVSACVEELLLERGTAKRLQQQQQLKQQAEVPGAAQQELLTVFDQSKSRSSRSGAFQATIPRASLSQHSDKSAKSNHSHQSVGEGNEDGSGKNSFSMAVENDNGVAESVNPLRAHFLAAADTKMLMQMLGKSQPMRSQHIGVCILSLFFYSPLPDGAPKLSQSQPRVRTLDVHALVPCLQHLVALEKIELLSRYGMGMLNAAAAETGYANSLKLTRTGGAAASMPRHALGSPATHHHAPRRTATANVGKGANDRPFQLFTDGHDHRRATVASASYAELFGTPEHQPASNVGTASTANGAHSSSGKGGSSSSSIPLASTAPASYATTNAPAQADASAGGSEVQGQQSAAPASQETANAAAKADALASRAGVQGQFVWPSDGAPIVLSKSSQDSKLLTCTDGSLVGGPPRSQSKQVAMGHAAASGAEAGADASAAAGGAEAGSAAGASGRKGAHIGSSGQAPPVMGHHVRVPLRDLRWKSHGSEVSVHAAVCCWGCASVVAEQECSKEQQHHQRLAAFKGSTVLSNHNTYATSGPQVQPLQRHMTFQARAEQRGKDLGTPNALGAAVKARAGCAALDQQEQTTLLLMQMLVQGLKSPCNGPATHLLSSAMVVMAHEPAAVPMLLKLGLIDAGDQKGLLSSSAISAGKPKQAKRGVLSQERWSMELSDMPPRGGVMGVMSRAHHANHARCLVALIACVALANPGPPSGKPPNPCWVFEASPIPKESTPSENGLERAGGIKHNGTKEEEEDSVLAREGANGRLRLLRAGAWPLLQACRDTCESPQTSELQQALAIAYMYLGQEIEQSYNKVLEAARQERRAQRASVPAAADTGAAAASSAAAVTETGDLKPSGSHTVDSISKDGASQQSSLPSTLTRNESYETLSDTDSMLEQEGQEVNMEPVYKLLLASKYSTLEEAVKPLCELLSCGSVSVGSDDASASLAGIHMFASLATHSLAAVPGLKEPLGEAGAIPALVDIIRRWVDLPLIDQRSQKRSAENALAALTRLMQGPEGAENIMRFAASWKTGSKEAVARELMKEFGAADLVGEASWSPWGRGSKHAAAHVRALEQQQPLGASGQWHKYDTVGCAAEVDQMAAWPSFQDPNRANDQESTNIPLSGPQGGKLKQERETQRSSSRGGHAPRQEDKYSATLSDSRSALDPIQVMVQVVAVRTKQKSRYVQLKLHALLALKIVAQVGDIRQRLIESGAGPQLAELAGDAGFDSRTRAAAGSLWLEISHTREGQWPLWWSCMMQEAGADPPLSMFQLHEKYGEDYACVTAQMRMCFLMLQSREPETELVEMCNKVLRLMLHINSKHGRLNGYKPAEENVSERESLNSSMSGSHAPSVMSSVRSRRMKELDNSMTYAIIYCSSGCLWNLSRNPDNRDLLYRVELEVKSRQAMVDVLEEGVLPATPQNGAFRSSQLPPTANGMPIDARTAALLQELLAEPLVEEEEHHARLDGRDVGFDMGGQARSLSRSHSGREPVAAEPTLQRRSSFGGLDPADSGTKRPASLSQYRGSRAASHRDFGSDTSSSIETGSYRAQEGLTVPRLATLQRRLQAPRASMFAPLSVDKHNTAAAALFALRGEQPLQVIPSPLAAEATSHEAVGDSSMQLHPTQGDGQPHTSSSLAGPQHVEHTAESAEEDANSSAQSQGVTSPGKTRQQQLQQQRQQEQQALWHRVQRQRHQRHRLHHGALSGSTVLRPYTAPSSGPSSRWSAHIGSCTLHPPSPPPLFPADRVTLSPKPAFAKACAAAAAQAATAEAAAAAAAMPENEWGLKGSLQLEPWNWAASASGALSLQHGSASQVPFQTRHPLNTQPQAMQGEDSLPGCGTTDVCLSFLPGSQHVRVRGLRGASDAHSLNWASHRGAQGRAQDAHGLPKSGIYANSNNTQRLGASCVHATNASGSGPYILGPLGETLGATSMHARNAHTLMAHTATAHSAAAQLGVRSNATNGGATMSMVEACQGVLQQPPMKSSQHMDRVPLEAKAHKRAALQPHQPNAPTDEHNLASRTKLSAPASGPDNAGRGRSSQKPRALYKAWRGIPEWKLDSKQKALRDFEVPGAAAWPAVEGSALGQSLFTKYTPENGGAAHPGGNVQALYIYRNRKTRVDETPPPQDPNAHRSFDFGCSISLEGPWTEMPFQPVMPKLEVPRPPMFEHSLLPDLKSLSTLDAVVSPKPSPTSGAGGQDVRSEWRLEDSVFAHRPKQCESKDFYDNQGITDMVMEQDLSRCMDKRRFQKFLNKWAPKDAREELVAELKRRYADLLRIFDWYACTGSGDPFSIQVNDKSKGCKLSDLDRVFLATNLEEGKSEADKINLDNSLMRFEFLEAILRVTVVKYFESKPLKQKGKQASGAKDESKKHAEQKGDAVAVGDPIDSKSLPKPTTLAEAVSRVFDYHLLPGVPPECLLDTNAWRKERLYTEDVDLLLKANLPVLRSVFNHYAALLVGHDMKLMDLPEWMEILTEADLFKTCRDFNVRNGKLAFIWSRMRRVVDSESLKALQRSRALTFEEFLDALCHVADMTSPPPVPELRAIGCTEHHPTTNYFMKVSNEVGPLPRRDSATITAPKTRPLDEKLEQVLELLLDNLMARHNARNHAHLMERLKAGRGRDYHLGKG
ncbi:hypothetical protein DUNSADRAFT_11605 [Dunaliella salina]|uniref:Uncharacterized protein n=1 Tax=Dunaliella salina TaxID=3046 RepID=A0ABQ7GD26_DUNSA|nr:hypothetical protein DUNSADRAFT_11605 [Dunaliella salina]|eukprot:KAF5832483.1 hypothetical protein DUNSADRAFT_11605 [Dunaliella salina]